MAELSKSFPAGLEYRIIYDPTEFIQQSQDAVIRTIFEAIVLVVLVVVLFLQSWRAAVIPIVAIPVSLVGTFFIMSVFGFSLNNLSMFGLVLAIGIVVDDAIVVVENVERNIHDGLSPRDAARRTMDEVGAALVAIALVLSAVFVPTGFIPGISGQFYRQFALTIAGATLISLIVSLTLSPALCALLLQPKQAARGVFSRGVAAFFGAFNWGFNGLSRGYGALVKRVVRAALITALVYLGIVAFGLNEFRRTPTGFIPQIDAGYLITVTQLPPAASLDRTSAVNRRAVELALETPGVAHAVNIVGFSGATRTNAPNAGAVFVTLKPFEERAKDPNLSANAIRATLIKKFSAIREGNVFVVPPPSVRGIGSAGGFRMMIQDRSASGPAAMQQAVSAMMEKAAQTPGVQQVFSLFENATPQIYLDIDRDRAQILGVNISDVFAALQTYLGSAYVNDFNLLGRTFRVTAQADARFRNDWSDIPKVRVRNAEGSTVPLGSFTTVRDIAGPSRVPRYNLFPAAELDGVAAPGFSTEWTELAFQQIRAGNAAIFAFLLGVAFVFLVLAAQFESLTLPLAVILIVPMSLVSAISGVIFRGMDNNILTQVGFVVLIGLAAKNAILIVEFAAQLETQGKSRFEAAAEAAQLRMRPIVMTSLAFVLGVLPLMLATGAGAELRQALGTAVFFGMLGVTVFGLIFTPAFYVLCRTRRRGISREGQL
jgi:hydrophobe/amphiphile efflux-1 (HAE1) family protein